MAGGQGSSALKRWGRRERPEAKDVKGSNVKGEVVRISDFSWRETLLGAERYPFSSSPFLALP